MNRKHIFFYTLLRPLVVLFAKVAFGYRFQKAKDIPGNYIVLANHATDFDPLLVGAAFSRQMYFVASEHVARFPTAGKLLTWVFDPIYRSKGASAANAVMEILRRTRRGCNVCMFPEGVRTWDGLTCPISPATAKMVRSAKCGLVTFRMDGGYFASPMWGGASIRRGRLQGQVVNCYSPQELADMTQAQLHEAICRDLQADAYALQAADPVPYRCKRRAERLENLLFLCPECGGMDTFRSQGDTVSCVSCGHSFQMDAYGMLRGTRFDTPTQFAQWQKEALAQRVRQGLPSTARQATLSTLRDHSATVLDRGSLVMDDTSLICGNTAFPLADIQEMATHGQRSLVFTAQKQYYELVVDAPDNALKFSLHHGLWKAKTKEKVG